MIETSQQHYPVNVAEPWKYFHYDEATRGKHDRLPIEPYAVFVRDQVDPDTEHAGVPLPLLKARGVQGITLLEHLLFNLKSFQETGLLLDHNDMSTYCIGSRDSGKCIPTVSSGGRRFGKKLYITSGFHFNRDIGVREVLA